MAETTATFSEKVQVTPSGAALGADIAGVDLSAGLSEETFAAIEAAWLEHLVLRFRDQDLSDATLVAFSRRFGKLDRAPKDTTTTNFVPEHPEVLIVSNVLVDGEPIGSLGSYESVWHTDMSYITDAPKASLLYALEVPERGGDTSFCNMYAAYETLPADLRSQIEGRRCKHDASRNSAGELRAGLPDVTDPRDAPGVFHPLVRTHPDTKRKALYLGRRHNASIEGLPLGESEALLDRLWEHANQPQFTWTQQWRSRDLILWDNRCVMHRRDAFDASARRVMHRTQVQGDRPV